MLKRIHGGLTALLLAAGLLQAPLSWAQEVLHFPGVKDAPDPGALGYGDWPRPGQPVRIVFGVADPVRSGLRESLYNAALSIQYMKLKHIEYQIEFVLYGNAVRAADPLNQDYAALGDLMHSLHEAGVEFVVCFNSLSDVGLSPGDIYPYMKLVPAGILELARRQSEGYAYIRNF